MKTIFDRVMRRQDYHFMSHWLIPASPLVVDRLLFTADTARWWPGLVSITVVDTDQPEPQRYRCIWRSRSGYQLTTIITVTSHQVGYLVRFQSEGDLRGSGSFLLETVNDGNTKITIHWDVTPTKAWMTYGAFIFRRLFIKNHHSLMKDGERGLIDYVARMDTSPTDV